MTPRDSIVRRTRPTHVLWAGLFLLLAGCASAPRAETAGVDERAAAFRNGLAMTASFVQDAELAAARAELAATAALAETEAEQAKVRSLARLIDGAEALLAGDTEGAGAEWARIEDPALRREIELAAPDVGVSLRSYRMEGGLR